MEGHEGKEERTEVERKNKKQVGMEGGQQKKRDVENESGKGKGRTERGREGRREMGRKKVEGEVGKCKEDRSKTGNGGKRRRGEGKREEKQRGRERETEVHKKGQKEGKVGPMV